MQPHIIIADDHSMIRKGIKLLLMSQLGYRNVTEAGSCNELMNELKKNQCSHLILDVIFSDGTALEVISGIRELYPSIHVMIFSMQLTEVYAEAFRQYGVEYYLNKSTNEDETLQYLRRFLSNESFKPPQGIPVSTQNPFTLLSPRELEILHYLLNGHKTIDIAQNLNLSNSTVSTIKKRILEKTDTQSTTQLLELALLYNISF
jgi:DNA-binding NarL/FixJ family response regulator